MTGQARRRLQALADDIDRARMELDILREQLLFQAEVLEDARVRMLVAETPIADREFRVAEQDHGRVERLMAEGQRDLAELLSERDRLLEGLGARRAG